MRWRGSLIEKEFYQNAGTIIAIVIAVVGYASLSITWPVIIPYGADIRPQWCLPILYWVAFAMIAILGSAFVGEENATRTINFLLRLPLTRRRLYFHKLLGHLLLFGFGMALVLAVLATFSAGPHFTWSPTFPGPFRLTREHILIGCELLLYPFLTYFVAALFSVVLDRILAAFLAAMATVVLIYGASQYAGYWTATKMAGNGLPDLEFAQFVSLVVVALVVPCAAAMAWWLFRRKEGR